MTVRTEYLGDHVSLVEFCEPPHNFFNPEMLWEIYEAYRDLGADGRSRAIVLGSEGRHFCAGANFRKTVDPDAPPPPPRPHLYQIAILAMSQPLPVVAAVQGSAVGGGLGLALSADFRVATPDARLTANFARIGFHHGFGMTATLPRIVGQQKALEMLYTGRDVSGTEALEIGLVDRLAEADELRGAAIAFATEIAQSAPLSLLSVRETMRRPLLEEFRRAVDRELAEQNKLRETEDFKIGFSTKRGEVPQFLGR